MKFNPFFYTQPEPFSNDFRRVACHELSAPLTALKLQAHLLNKHLTRQGLHDCVAILARMEEQIQKLERLNADLLNTSSIQAGEFAYVEERVDLNTLLQEIVDVVQQIHPTHTIIVRGVAETCLIGDKDRLGQVFINLLDNAIKYSPHAKMVEVDIYSSVEAITVSVCDHGIGIPQGQCEHIFERFYRADDPAKNGIPGQGIGLYVVARIVEHYEGTVTVESATGKGSTFRVRLPLIRKQKSGERG